jgi:hypothetical protein
MMMTDRTNALIKQLPMKQISKEMAEEYHDISYIEEIPAPHKHILILTEDLVDKRFPSLKGASAHLLQDELQSGSVIAEDSNYYASFYDGQRALIVDSRALEAYGVSLSEIPEEQEEPRPLIGKHTARAVQKTGQGVEDALLHGF